MLVLTALWALSVVPMAVDIHVCQDTLEVHIYHTNMPMLLKTPLNIPLLYEIRCEKSCLRGFRPGPTQTGLYCHRRWLEA